MCARMASTTSLQTNDFRTIPEWGIEELKLIDYQSRKWALPDLFPTNLGLIPIPGDKQLESKYESNWLYPILTH